MYVENNDNFYYLTLMNENYHHSSKPSEITDDQIMKGACKLISNPQKKLRILSSGVTVNFAIKAEIELKKWALKVKFGQ